MTFQNNTELSNINSLLVEEVEQNPEKVLYNTSFTELNQDILTQILPKTSQATKNKLLIHCNNIFPKYGINTPERIAMWFAQCGHESADFTRFVENLNYSAEGLLKTFPKYFTKEEAKACARKPEMIANKVYNDANRSHQSKLGNTQKGDGWKYRGRGFIQITGRNNYTNFARFVGKLDIIENPDVLATDFEIMVLCACWFFKEQNINAFSDKKDIIGATKRINGGVNGLSDRERKFKHICEILLDFCKR